MLLSLSLPFILVAGCNPDFGAPLSLVSETRILAVRGVPAEAAPGQSVAWEALVASPGGTAPSPSLSWAFCTSPKPPSDNGTVNSDCFSTGAAPAGAIGPMLTATILADTCARFGPQTPPSLPGAPPGRPRDPDVTGGYYQPLLVTLGPTLGDNSAIWLSRVECDLAQASFDVAADFRARYRPNVNPTLAGPLTASLDGAPLALDQLPAGRTVQLTIAWTADSAELYPVFDRASQTLVDHRESLRVSWYATAGKFEAEHTGRDEADPARSSDNRIELPAQPGALHLWVVLRDARGGVDYAAADVTVVAGP